MNFQELGLALQREREAKGLTIEAVMEATKISRINLLALESGDRSTLPHPVYTKGFIRSYARLLELDADELSMVVDREYQAEEQEAEEVAYDVSPAAGKALQDSEVSTSKRKKRAVWPSILAFVALAIAGVLLVLNLNKGGVKPTPDAAPAVEQTAPAEEQVAPAAEEHVAPTVDEQTAPTVDEQTAPAAEEQVVPTGQSAQPSASVSAGDSVPAEQAQEEASGVEAPTPAVQSGTESEAAEEATVAGDAAESSADQDDGLQGIQYDHVLIIRATTDKGCWIGLWKGDEPNMARDFVLKKGEPLRLMFNSPRRIRIGNVAGVVVTYNGNPYPLEKNKSNIQTLVFGAD